MLILKRKHRHQQTFSGTGNISFFPWSNIQTISQLPKCVLDLHFPTHSPIIPFPPSKNDVCIISLSLSSSSLELSLRINKSHLVPSTSHQDPPSLSSRVKNSADICTNLEKAGWLAYFCTSWGSMSGLCLDCLISIAALRPED